MMVLLLLLLLVPLAVCRPIQYTSGVCHNYIQLACVPDTWLHVAELTECYVSGWGVTHARSAQPAQTAEVLQEARVQLIDLKRCNSTWWYGGAVHPHNLCAGYPQGGIDTCQRFAKHFHSSENTDLILVALQGMRDFSNYSTQVAATMMAALMDNFKRTPDDVQRIVTAIQRSRKMTTEMRAQRIIQGALPWLAASDPHAVTLSLLRCSPTCKITDLILLALQGMRDCSNSHTQVAATMMAALMGNFKPKPMM
ncbi:UNVERIFIED_CONTAM: hypothetical protein H355_004804 [Colinus virginianus]|nr:hypothetical protein H355_004804 [Colinus virginianus]